jgi:hypothetical protein
MVVAAATNAPPKMAGQVTAETEDSVGTRAPVRDCAIVSMLTPSIVGMTRLLPENVLLRETVGGLNSSFGAGAGRVGRETCERSPQLGYAGVKQEAP